MTNETGVTGKLGPKDSVNHRWSLDFMPGATEDFPSVTGMSDMIGRNGEEDRERVARRRCCDNLGRR